jgi:hypothetical protein
MFIQVARLSVDGHEGTSDGPSPIIFGVKSADVKLVNDKREAGALAKGAVNANVVWEVPFWQWVEGDKLTVAKPHGKVGDHPLLLFQPGRKIPVARDKRVGLVNQVARECAGGKPLLWRFPGGLVHGRWQSGAIAVLWRQ